MAKGAELTFTRPQIKGIVTTVGENIITFEQDALDLGLTKEDKLKMISSLGLSTRHIVNKGETIIDLSLTSARNLISHFSIPPEDIQAIILVTQSPLYSAPASAIKLQHLLGMNINSMAYDLRLGCSGFLYGLSNAFSLIESGLDRIILCVGDIASTFVDNKDRTLSPLMGDSASAILIEKSKEPTKSFFQFYSDGSGEKALYIPNSGSIKSTNKSEINNPKMTMDGAAVFTFTLKRVPEMIKNILIYSDINKEEIDYYLLHQPNKYILSNIQKRLKISPDNIPMSTQSIYGNQNSGSIPGTINGFLSTTFSTSSLKSILAGFGIGLSWSAAIVDTSNIYAPNPIVGIKGNG